VARHIFQACPVWIYTQSNITNIIPTQKKFIYTFIKIFIYTCKNINKSRIKNTIILEYLSCIPNLNIIKIWPAKSLGSVFLFISIQCRCVFGIMEQSINASSKPQNRGHTKVRVLGLAYDFRVTVAMLSPCS
jgi:hypothetical protein